MNRKTFIELSRVATYVALHNVVFYLSGYSIYINYFFIYSVYTGGTFVAKLLPFANSNKAFHTSNQDDKYISN